MLIHLFIFVGSPVIIGFDFRLLFKFKKRISVVIARSKLYALQSEQNPMVLARSAVGFALILAAANHVLLRRLQVILQSTTWKNDNPLWLLTRRHGADSLRNVRGEGGFV